jgi:hypothetical protein
LLRAVRGDEVKVTTKTVNVAFFHLVSYPISRPNPEGVNTGRRQRGKGEVLASRYAQAACRGLCIDQVFGLGGVIPILSKWKDFKRSKHFKKRRKNQAPQQIVLCLTFGASRFSAVYLATGISRTFLVLGIIPS